MTFKSPTQLGALICYDLRVTSTVEALGYESTCLRHCSCILNAQHPLRGSVRKYVTPAYYHYQCSVANVQLHVSTCCSATAVARSLQSCSWCGNAILYSWRTRSLRSRMTVLSRSCFGTIRVFSGSPATVYRLLEHG